MKTFEQDSSHYSEPDSSGVYRGPAADMPLPYLEEEAGKWRFVIPNLNTESHLELAGNSVHKAVDAFTCRDYHDPLQRHYPITITSEKTGMILKGLAALADKKVRDPLLNSDYAGKILNRIFGIDEDLGADWFLKLCEREKEAQKEYN